VDLKFTKKQLYVSITHECKEHKRIGCNLYFGKKIGSNPDVFSKQVQQSSYWDVRRPRCCSQWRNQGWG